MTQGASGKPVRLISKWFVLPGHERAVLPALRKLAAVVRATEPGTLMYLVHTPYDQRKLRSTPPPNSGLVLFFEMHASPKAFDVHVNGSLFTTFDARGLCAADSQSGSR